MLIFLFIILFVAVALPSISVLTTPTVRDLCPFLHRSTGL